MTIFRRAIRLSLILCVSLFGGWGIPAHGAAEEEKPSAQKIYFFDMTESTRLNLGDPVQARRAWDTAHLVASLQGIVNRREAVLFVRFDAPVDDFWFSWLREPGNWLAGREVVRLDSLEALLRQFQQSLKGVVLYKEDVWATSNLASTVAGVEDRLCLRFDPAPDSVCQRVLALDLPFLKDAFKLYQPDGSPLFTGKGKIPGTDLNSTGSVKCDAYLWAKQRFLDSGLCDPRYLAYYIDTYWLKNPAASSFSNATVTNHDYFISKKAFFFDLHVWPEEAPVDDPGQKPGTDVETLRSLLFSAWKRANGQILQIGGFTPWIWKYTSHPGAGSKHDGVDTEWKYAQIISQYNGIMDADALGYSGMANASFYTHFPLKDHYPQNPRPTLESLKAQGYVQPDGQVAPYHYVAVYMGDYDSSAWLQRVLPEFWNDPARGQIPCSWAFNPNLDQRAPHVLHYVRTKQSPQDWFISGDSGAGYLNPGMLSVSQRTESGTSDGWDVWIAHNKVYFKRYDLSVTGFAIDGHAPGMGERGLDGYLEFSPDGLVGQKVPRQALHKGQMPVTQMRNDFHTQSPEEAARGLVGLTQSEPAAGPHFFFVRTILKSPSWHKATFEKAREAEPRIRLVDAYTFFLLEKIHEKAQEKGGAPPS
jgi:hypothetical protein